MIDEILKSARNNDDISHVIKWIDTIKQNTKVKIEKSSLTKDTFWFFDEDTGVIKNKANAFFNISGIKSQNEQNIIEQPIIVQNEIGFLGFIIQEIDGVLKFLVQAKIEPGNINVVQLSPSIQATKSNFSKKHGGNFPAYLELFLEVEEKNVIVDQLQSEQSSRFYKKRNRNIIINVDEPIQLLPNFCWLTLGQLKKLMYLDNIINMDTRTVLSCIPYLDSTSDRINFKSEEIFNSLFNNENNIPKLYKKINDIKMFDSTSISLVSLRNLKDWKYNDGFLTNSHSFFEVIFCNIEIDGREVRSWSQPLIKANCIALLGLFCKVVNNKLLVLIKLYPEIGCFDLVEIGPTIILENENQGANDKISVTFNQYFSKGENVLINVLLSEEGGRFYHEQNRNVIIKIQENELNDLPNNYAWVDLKTLYQLIRINNCCNIQLRNLLSLLEI